MDEFFVKDFQFQDWFPNYSGRFQDFTEIEAEIKVKQMPNWWTDAEEWGDPWFLGKKEKGGTTIRRDVLKAVIDHINKKGGRAWAYVQAQGSEYYNLKEKGIHKLMIGDVWVHQLPRPSDRIFPLYFMDEKLAKYQCDAWAEIVKEFGFVGIQWDSIKTPNDLPGRLWQQKEGWIKGAYNYLLEAHGHLQRHGLLQAFNDINGNFRINIEANKNLFPGVLAFPYQECWEANTEDKFYDFVTKSNVRGAVLTAYPGSVMFGCCAQTPAGYVDIPVDQIANICKEDGVCKICGDPKKQYKTCPKTESGGIMTQVDLLTARLQRATLNKPPIRYLVLGDGARYIPEEYFPNTKELDEKARETVAGFNKKYEISSTI